MVEAASAPHPLSETELLDYLCVFKPETVAVTEVLYEAISSADFTLSEVTETALGDPYSGARNVVAKAAARLGLFMEVEVERPKHVMGQFPKYYTITEKAVHFAEAHNRLHLRLIRQEAFGSVPAADIVRLSRNAFQYTMGLPVRPVLQVNMLSERTGLHPATVMHRALGAYAVIVGVQNHVRLARGRLIKERLAELAAADGDI